VLIIQVSKKNRKKSKIAKNNRKRTAIISHQKILIIAKIACVTIIAKCLWCDCHPWF